MPTGADLSRLLVLAVVACCQLALLRRARRLAHADDSPRLTELGTAFAGDLKERAERGEGPDWQRYRGELDRLFEQRDERLRSLAAAALAAGLGSTLLALLVGLPADMFRHAQAADPLAVLASTVICLLGSLLGVIVNLVIVLRLLPAAESRFTGQADSLLAHLQAAASRHLPLGALTGALRDELGAIRRSLSAGLTEAVSEAVTGWPRIVERLGGQVDALGTVVAAQGEAIGGAIGDLRSCSLAVANSSQRLQPAAQQLGETAALLVDLPAELRAVIEGSRDTWLASLREQQEAGARQLVALRREAEEASQARERQMLAAVRELQAAVAEVRAAVGQIPGQLSAEVAEVSGRLGREFGSEARVLTQELAASMVGQQEQLLRRVEQHEQQWRNNIGAVVEELLAQVSSRIEAGVMAQLQDAGTELQRIATALPEAAARLAASQAEWTAAQQEALAGWKQISLRLHEAARQLVTADGQLDTGVAALAASAQHLERIAQVNGSFEESLRTVLGEVTARHLAGLEPFIRELMQMARELDTDRSQFDSILDRQSELVRRCLDRLMQGRRVATLEPSA